MALLGSSAKWTHLSSVLAFRWRRTVSARRLLPSRRYSGQDVLAHFIKQLNLKETSTGRKTNKPLAGTAGTVNALSVTANAEGGLRRDETFRFGGYFIRSSVNYAVSVCHRRCSAFGFAKSDAELGDDARFTDDGRRYEHDEQPGQHARSRNDEWNADDDGAVVRGDDRWFPGSQIGGNNAADACGDDEIERGDHGKIRQGAVLGKLGKIDFPPLLTVN